MTTTETLKEKETMRKNIALKAAIATGLTLLMSATAASTAFALDPPPGPYYLMIHKYIGTSPSGLPGDGTLITDTSLSGLTPVGGVVFDLYQVGAAVNNTPAYPSTPLQGTYSVNGGTGNLIVSDSGGNTIGEYVLAAASSPTVTTGIDGTVITTLAQGLYLVVEDVTKSLDNGMTDGAGNPLYISQASAPFLVEIPMTNSTGDGWLTTVHVYPKNEELQVTKTVDTTGAVAVGDVIHYTISASVPNAIATSKQFDMWDKFDPALTVGPIPVVSITTLPTDDAGLVKDTDYLVTYDGTDNKVTVSFLPPGLMKLAGYTDVVADVTATVNPTILTYSSWAVTNTATVDYTDPSDTQYTAVSDKLSPPTINTAAIQVTTVNQAGAPVTGAKFKVATSTTNAANNHFVQIDPVTGILYDFGDPGYGDTTENPNLEDYEIDPANVDTFEGLRDWVDNAGTPAWQTYYVVETAAPTGYNALTAPIPVTFAATDNHLYKLTVTYSEGFLLPVTGGMGTILWTVAGIVLMGTAALLVVTKRKKTVAR